VPLVAAALLVLGALEIRQHVARTPALAAHLAPAVEIGVLAAYVEHAVDRRRTAEDLALGPQMRVADRGIVLGEVHPVDVAVVQGLAEADRRVDQHVRPELAEIL
jgi:hypothetical protein